MAGRVPAQGDELAGPQAGRARVNPGTKRLDDPGTLVTDHERAGPGPFPIAQVQVRVAHAAGQDPDAHFALPGLIEGQRLDCDGLTRLLQDGGTHADSVPDMTKPGAALAPGFDRCSTWEARRPCWLP